MSKRKREVKSRHHRKPRSLGGDNKNENIIIVSQELHRAWHLLFQNLTPEQICTVINTMWLDPDYYFICKKRSDIHKDSQIELYGDYA